VPPEGNNKKYILLPDDISEENFELINEVTVSILKKRKP
jgi:hypothetical protein